MPKEITQLDKDLNAAKTYFRSKKAGERSEYFSKVFVENGEFWDVSNSSTDSDKKKLIRDYNQRNPGFESRNVPDDGNCFYHSLKLALESYGIKPGDVNDIRRKLLETIDNDLSGILDVFASSHKKMTLDEIKKEDPLVENPKAKMDSHNNINDYKGTAQIAIEYEARDNILKGINSKEVQSPDAWGGVYEACVAAKAYGVNINFYDERVDGSGNKNWVATRFLADKSNPGKSASIGTQSSGANHIVFYSPTKHHGTEKEALVENSEINNASLSEKNNALGTRYREGKKSSSLPLLETKIAETILENHKIFKSKNIINLAEFQESIENSDSLAKEDRKKLAPLFKQMDEKGKSSYSKEDLTKLIAKSDFVKEQVMAMEQIKNAVQMSEGSRGSGGSRPPKKVDNSRGR